MEKKTEDLYFSIKKKKEKRNGEQPLCLSSEHVPKGTAPVGRVHDGNHRCLVAWQLSNRKKKHSPDPGFGSERERKKWHAKIVAFIKLDYLQRCIHIWTKHKYNEVK